MFAAWGRFVYRWRWATLVISAALLALSVFGVLRGGVLTSGNSTQGGLEADRAANLVNAQLSSGQTAGSSFLLIFSTPGASASDPAFRSSVEAALAPLAQDSRVTAVHTPFNAPTPAAAQALISKDGRQALVSVDMKSTDVQATKDYAALRAKVHGGADLTITGTGQVPINHAFSTTLESDLQRAETLSLPVALVLLLLIFGSVVAAGLPLGVGVLTILAGLAGTFLLSRVTDVSQYALNIVTLIGLAVAIDYSLFVVSRYRDELVVARSREEALAKTMATAGRAITFSGLTVAIGLSALLFYRGTFLASMGASGTIVVAAAVFYGLTFLPALLAVIGTGVNRLRLPLVSRRAQPGHGFWSGLANRVMQRPVWVLVPAVAVLVLIGTPFLHLRLANGDVTQLPTRLEARQGYDNLIRNFPGQDQNDFQVVLDYPDGKPLTAARIGAQYDLSRRLAAIPGVIRVNSIYSAEPALDRAGYQQLYANPSQLPPPARQALAQSVGRNIVVMTAVSNRPASSDAARTILKTLRAESVGDGGHVLVTGRTAFDVDIIGFIVGRTPLAVGVVILITYFVLFLLTGSLVLPLKAVLLNLLSISASFGALVWIFQDGHLSGLLGFTPQSIDPSVPVILFAIVFGMSMDYEVLLVSRIHEEYVRTGNNRRAVALGLERSGRLITGAAAIMVAVFLAFGLAEVVLIKSIGLGLAIAVVLDATIVRALVVPAVMRLLGDYNWWAPHPLRWLHRRAGLGEFGEVREAA
ncbi:MAG: MMPL family transporter [Candidatus Dormibacteraeota bacterium]|nr:MMPL family transporter [Candidatus Dormibacteraeota bacterium]